MDLKIDELSLDQTYSFDVKVRVADTFFMGVLDLSPTNITLKIRGEESGKRRNDLGWGDLAELSCQTHSHKIFLIGLRFCGGVNGTLQRHPIHVGHFTSIYEVDEAIYCKSNGFRAPNIYGYAIQSRSVEKWVGTTERQQTILEEYYRRENNFSDPSKNIEFAQDINGGQISIQYPTTTYWAATEYRAGIEFSPSFVVSYEEKIAISDIKNKFNNIYTFLSFVIGDELDIQKIILICRDGSLFNKLSYYYPTQTHPKSRKGSSPFFPLGHESKFDTLGLPSFPLDAIAIYFDLPERDSSYFQKYIKYRRLENPEERLLGYFRLLESLCYKEKQYVDEKTLLKVIAKSKYYLKKKFIKPDDITGLIKRLIAANRSKYNTEKCISDFFKQIPKMFSSGWRFERKHIEAICRLRNDISHANNFEPHLDLREKIKFLEVMLIFALFQKIDIDWKYLGRIIDRLDGYFLIKKEADLKIVKIIDS
jgi:hypothetical protein